MTESVVGSERKRWLPIFFGVAACSWMPHWLCHYYRLETGSSFVVGSWDFCRTDSIVSMVVYSGLITLNLLAIGVNSVRVASALRSGICHTAIGLVHVVRLARPFRFEVFNLPWSQGASSREVAIVIGFGLVCLAVAWFGRRNGA